MTNPVTLRKPTPSGGDYSELWYLDDDGNPVTDMAKATQYELIELTNGGGVVQSTLGRLQKGGK